MAKRFPADNGVPARKPRHLAAAILVAAPLAALLFLLAHMGLAPSHEPCAIRSEEAAKRSVQQAVAVSGPDGDTRVMFFPDAAADVLTGEFVIPFEHQGAKKTATVDCDGKVEIAP